MNESDRRQRVVSSTPRLSTDEIVNHSFAKGVRGYSETEVRAFLRRVSEELAVARGREHELEAAIDELEEQVRTPRALTEQQLLDALGEETARLLRSAREASDDIRKKAEERAARLVEDATTAGERTRAEAAELLATRTAEAEAKMAELIGRGEAKASSAIETATAEAEMIVDQARRQGHEMLDEAKAARERVLGDLVRRRALLNGQIEALRTGRDRLLDAYRTVKGTFLQATEALAQVEARAAAERSTSVSEPVDIAAEIAAEIDKLDEGVEHGADTPSGDGKEESLVIVTASVGGSDAEVATALADVDSLFARLRAGHDEAGPDPAQTVVMNEVVVDESGIAETDAVGDRVHRRPEPAARSRRRRLPPRPGAFPASRIKSGARGGRRRWIRCCRRW